jgi:hypothetical protein
MRWELASRVRTRMSGAHLRPFCTVSVMLLGLLAGIQASAQQAGAASRTPDAPSTTAQSNKGSEHKPDSTEAMQWMNLLSGRSLMFPNLAVNNKPLKPKQKFFLAANNSVSGITLIGTAAGAGISQARDSKTGYGQGAEGYFKRWGSGMAFSASSNMIGTFAIASILHEDPRYFVEDSGKFRESVRYAVSRVVICRRDNGTTGTNWAGILGPLGAAALANTYLPKDSQGVGNTFGNWGFALGVNAGTNLLREYWPHINKRLRLPSMGLATPPNTVKPADQSTPPPQQPTAPK